MVGNAASHRGKESVTTVESLNKCVVGVDINVGHLGKAVDIGIVGISIGYSHSLVGTPCRKHLYLEAGSSYITMIAERVDRVIGGAHHLNTVAAH